MFATEFFFLRPYWLLLVVPALWFVWLALRENRGGADTAWSRLVDPHLLAALSVGRTKGARSRWLPAALGAALLAATVAMAGPTWQKIEQPSFKSKAPVVVAMSLAQSMNADDIKPTRLVRAGHKLRDILVRQDGGDVGLVIYSDRPFTAAPLTEDGEVIREMLPELSTDLMPVLGNRADLAIAQSAELLKNAGAESGRIVLLSDSAGADPAASIAAARAAHAEGYEVDVIGIGTDTGATLRTASGRAITANDGATMTAGFDADGLKRIASAGGGTYAPLSADNADIDRVLPESAFEQPGGMTQQDDFKADGWADMGFWLLLVPVLLAPLAFRRNVLLMLPLALALMAGLPSGRAEAADLAGLWKTPDQQGATAFAGQDYEAAATKFKDRGWRAASHYRAGDYKTAANELAGTGAPDDTYNRGNALAKSGDLEGALKAYDQSLKVRPDDADTQYNRDLVAKLLEQQKQQQQQNQQDQQNQQQQQQQQQGGQSQDQQQNGQGQQDQKQADQQQQNGEGQQDQQQADQQQQNGQGQQDQQQADQQQQNGEGQQDQKQADQQKQDGQGQQDQQQADQQQQNGEGQQDQQQADQQQNGQGQQDQQQADQQQQNGQGQQDQKQADQQKQDGQGQQDQKQADQQQQNGQPRDRQQNVAREQTDEQAEGGAGEDPQEKSAFRKAMDAILNGNAGDRAEPDETPEPVKVATSGQGITEQEQANEQLLRSVPDDASGLLRARIRQNYARLR